MPESCQQLTLFKVEGKGNKRCSQQINTQPCKLKMWCFLNKEKSELCMKQHFKYIFAKIIRLSNGMKGNQLCSYMRYFYICSKQNKNLGVFFLGFFVCKYSPFLLAQIAGGCFCSTSTGIPPLSVHFLLVKGLYQES